MDITTTRSTDKVRNHRCIIKIVMEGVTKTKEVEAMVGKWVEVVDINLDNLIIHI